MAGGDDEMVTAFLSAAGRNAVVGPELVEAWRPVVAAAGPVNSPRWRAARHLAAHAVGDQVPSVAEVEAEAARRVQQAKDLAAGVEADAAGSAERARAFVAQVRTASGAGPTWGELGAHLGWTKRHAMPRIRRMITTGALVAGSEHRSLDIAPRRRRTDSPRRAAGVLHHGGIGQVVGHRRRQRDQSLGGLRAWKGEHVDA